MRRRALFPRRPPLAACVLGILLACTLILTACTPDEPITEDFVIVAFGDSLTYGYKLTRREAFPAQLERKFHSMGYTGVKVKNEGKSGDTTLGGLYRIRDVMRHRPDVIIIELGANDLLRRVSPLTIEQNLSHLIEQLRADGALILLAGVDGPLFRLGYDYTDEYATLFNRVATKYDVAFYPNFLEGVLGEPALNLSDGLHPNPKGVTTIVDSVFPYVLELAHKKASQLNRERK